MSDKKFARQLTLDLADINPFKSRQQIADEIPVSAGQLSNISHGKRNADKQTMKRLTKSVSSFLLKLSAARSDYGTPSFYCDAKLRNTPFVTAYKQEQEERERKELEWPYRQAISKKESERTAQDWAIIKDYFKEYIEEIGSEQLDLDTKRKDAGLSEEKFNQIVTQYNHSYGG